MMSSADISNPFIMLFMASFLHGIAEPAAERFFLSGVLDVTGEKMASGKPLLDFDPYEILYLERGCTDAEIVKAFRRAALKWHPDKNPDRIQTAQDMFLKISKAFALLSDVTARAAYDHVLAAKAAREAYVQQRQRNENEKRRKLREELEKREADAANARKEEETAKKQLEKEIERLRREGSKLLQRERENVEREVHRDTSTKQGCANDSPFTRYKLRWEREVSERDYCEEDIRQLFSKYGDISDVVVSSSGRGSAIIEFSKLKDEEGIIRESGKPENPVSVVRLRGPPLLIKNPLPTPQSPSERAMTSTQFADFEAEVLATLAAGTKRKMERTASKFDDL